MQSQAKLQFKSSIFLVTIICLANLSNSITLVKINHPLATTVEPIVEQNKPLPSEEECKENAYQAGCPGEEAEECNSIWNELTDDPSDAEYEKIEKKQDECVKKWCSIKENKWVCQDLKVDPNCYNSDRQLKGCPNEKPDCDSKDDVPTCINKFCDERKNIANEYCRNVYMGLVIDVFSTVNHNSNKGELIDNTRVIFCPPFEEGFPYDVPECSKYYCFKLEKSRNDLIKDPVWIEDQLKICESYKLEKN